ncbi:MAG: RDD family protein [Nitrospirae bacterium]|nr:RDD family protein [Nitrospirota bacterium]
MRCPRCGYTTDEFEACPQCSNSFETGGVINLHTLPKAGFWVRFVAFAIDNIIIFFSTAFLAFIAGLAAGLGGLTRDLPSENVEQMATIFGFFIGIFLGPSYFTLFTGWEGQTPGKRIMGLKVVRMKGGPVTYPKALLRYIGYYISFLPAGLGFVMIAVDRNKRGLHDLIAGTCVIKIGNSE